MLYINSQNTNFEADSKTVDGIQLAHFSANISKDNASFSVYIDDVSKALESQIDEDFTEFKKTVLGSPKDSETVVSEDLI
jgi:hypothetical protein